MDTTTVIESLALEMLGVTPERLHAARTLGEAGIDSLGMHLEAVTPEVRERVMPGKATVPVATLNRD